jgi:hypothetical protein
MNDVRQAIRNRVSFFTTSRRQMRNGASSIEFCIVAPVLFLLLFGIIAGAVAVFRTHQVSAIATDATRWAAVRGREYERMMGKAPITQDDVWEGVKARASGMDPNKLSLTLSWSEDRKEVIAQVTYVVFNGWCITGYSRQPIVF